MGWSKTVRDTGHGTYLKLSQFGQRFMVWSFWTWKCVQDQSQNALIWNLASDITMICSVWWFAYVLHSPLDSRPISLLFLHSC